MLQFWPQSGQKTNDPPVSLPRRLRVEPVDQFFSCQVLQLLTLEAASRKRLPERREIAVEHVALTGDWALLEACLVFLAAAEPIPVPLRQAVELSYKAKQLGYSSGVPSRSLPRV